MQAVDPRKGRMYVPIVGLKNNYKGTRFDLKLDTLDSFAQDRLVTPIPKFLFDHQAIIFRILVAIRGISG